MIPHDIFALKLRTKPLIFQFSMPVIMTWQTNVLVLHSQRELERKYKVVEE